MYPADFEIQESPDGDWLRLTLLGELDTSAAPALEGRLQALHAAGRPVLLDLSRLEFMDSSGLALITKAIRSSWSDRWGFRIDPNLAPQVRRLFKVTALDEFAGIDSSDALSA